MNLQETKSNEYWMTLLPAHVRALPIIYLAIPGSHNSMTYEMHNEPAADASKSFKIFNKSLPKLAVRYTQTQVADIAQQLKLGVRYFDLRLTRHNNQYYFTHKLRCGSIVEPLSYIKLFLLQHRGEFIILDFQHFYGFEEEHHRFLHEWLRNLFGTLLYTESDGVVKKCTLDRCMIKWKQLLIVYRRCPIPLPHDFWHASVFPIQWSRTRSTTELQLYLWHQLERRSPAVGHVSKCILLPKKGQVNKFFSSLRHMAEVVNRDLEHWILSMQPGPFIERAAFRVNIIMGDFVDLKNGEFCDWVISLNNNIRENPPKKD